MKLSFKYLLLCVFGCLLFNPSAWSKSDPREWLPTSLWIKYSHEYPYVFLEDMQETRLNKDWSVDQTIHYRIKVQKESGKEVGEQKIYYNQSQDEFFDLQAHVETPDGKIYSYTSIQDLPVYQGSPLYSDLKVKVITLPQVNVGSIIDVSAKVKTKEGLIKGQYSEVEEYPVEPHLHYKSTYIFPKDMNIKLKTSDGMVPPNVEEDKTEFKYTFEYHTSGSLDNIEPFLPPQYKILGETVFSSMDSWQIIADWYRGLIQKNTASSPKILEKTKELINGKTTDKEKALAILEFLQDNMRYVSMSFGDNTVEPHPTDQIFQDRYGDCKDWSLLTKQMLNLAGIPASICLYMDEFGGQPSLTELPDISSFDHAMLEVLIDGKKYFVDPQLKNFDVGQFPNDSNNASVLVIEDNGYHFDVIQAAVGNDTVNNIQVGVILDSQGKANYQVKAKLSLELSNTLRQLWENCPELERPNFLQHVIAPFVKGQDVSDQEIKGFDQRYGPVTITFKVEIPSAYQLTNDLMILSESIDQYFPDPFMEPVRHFPIFMPFNNATRIQINYKIPKGFAVDDLPQEFQLSNDIFTLTRKLAQREGIVSILYVYQMKRGELSVSQYPQIQTMWTGYYQKSKDSIILKRVQ